MKGMCTLHELETVYSLEDLMDMNEAIRVQQAVESRAIKRANK